MEKCLLNFLHNLKDIMVISNRAKFHFEIRWMKGYTVYVWSLYFGAPPLKWPSARRMSRGKLWRHRLNNNNDPFVNNNNDLLLLLTINYCRQMKINRTHHKLKKLVSLTFVYLKTTTKQSLILSKMWTSWKFTLQLRVDVPV